MRSVIAFEAGLECLISVLFTILLLLILLCLASILQLSDIFGVDFILLNYSPSLLFDIAQSRPSIFTVWLSTSFPVQVQPRSLLPKLLMLLFQVLGQAIIALLMSIAVKVALFSVFFSGDFLVLSTSRWVCRSSATSLEAFGHDISRLWFDYARR